MDNKLRRVLALLTVAVLALALTLLLSSGDGARAMLQGSQVDSPIGAPSPTATETLVPAAETPNVEFATLAPPTSVPLPEPIGPTPTVRGFLPAPTIVNPDDIQSLQLAQPPVSSAGSSAEPAIAPTATPAGNATVRAAVALLNYLWLLCGGMLLIGGAVAIILLWRRGRQA